MTTDEIKKEFMAAGAAEIQIPTVLGVLPAYQIAGYAFENFARKMVVENGAIVEISEGAMFQALMDTERGFTSIQGRAAAIIKKLKAE